MGDKLAADTIKSPHAVYGPRNTMEAQKVIEKNIAEITLQHQNTHGRTHTKTQTYTYYQRLIGTVVLTEH